MSTRPSSHCLKTRSSGGDGQRKKGEVMEKRRNEEYVDVWHRMGDGGTEKDNGGGIEGPLEEKEKQEDKDARLQEEQNDVQQL